MLLVVIIGAFFINIFDDSGNAPPKKASSATSKPAEIVYNSAWDGSVRQVETYLNSNLKDPDSFEAIEWSEVQKVDAPNHKFIVRCRYRAKNSYGGYVISNQVFYLDSAGKVVNVMDWN